MTISFDQTAGNLRLPGYRNEFALGNPPFSRSMQVLIVGPVATGATVTTGVSQRPRDDIETAYGAGSLLGTMLNYAKLTRPFLDYRVLPLAETGTPASDALTVNTVPPVGTWPFWVLGNARRRQITVVAGDTVTTVAAKIAAAINTRVTLAGDGKALVDMVSATSALGVVTVTARNGGTMLNATKWVSFESRGEVSPLAAHITNVFTAGSGAPDIAAALAGVGTGYYAWVISAYRDTGSLAAIDTWLEAQWGPMNMNYGWAVAGVVGSQGTLATLGDAMNDRKRVLGGLRNSSEPEPIMAACFGADLAFVFDFARSITDVQIFARGLTGRAMKHLTGPWKEDDVFSNEQRNLLLYDGISPLVASEGQVQMERVITTFQRRASTGLEDISYLDINGPCIDAWVVQYQRHYIWNTHQNESLVGDQEDFANGQCRPKDARKTFVASYLEVNRRGRIVQDVASYEQALLVELAADPVRLNVQQKIYRANPLYIIATKSIVGELAPGAQA
jgi:phage tail sheath gpL-like